MADITEEERKPSLKTEFEERKRIVFHIAQLEGLPPQTGWQPLSKTYVSIESLETREYLPTESKKSAPTMIWWENMPTLDLASSSKVRFEVKHQMPWNRRATVLGATEMFDIHQMMEMQKQAAENGDSFIDLIVTFTPPSHPANGIPKRASLPPKLPSLPKPPSSPTAKFAVLRLSIRETAIPDKNNILTAANLLKFAEQCRRESLAELEGVTLKMRYLRESFDGTSYVCLVDMILSFSEDVRKLIANPDTKNVNRNTAATLKALNCAFASYQPFTARKLAKSVENSMDRMKEMLCGAIKTLSAIEAFLMMRNFPFAKDKLEFKVTDWMRYFQLCEKYLLGAAGGDSGKPIVPPRRTSKRVQCPKIMIANPELPRHNMVTMRLPEIYMYGTYDRPNLVRLIADWTFSSSFQPPASLQAVNNTFAKPNANTRTKPLNNVFCLSGSAGCGKTQLVARMAEWLSEVGCLGGYFTFDSYGIHSHEPNNINNTTGARVPQTPSELLDALPLTLIHQACTVEPDAISKLSLAFYQNPQAVHEPLDSRFEVLFTGPLGAFAEGREGAAWNPLDPMVFIIDGVGVWASGDAQQEEEEAKTRENLKKDGERTLQLFVEFLSSKAVRRLPAHVKFLVLTRPETGLDKVLKERGAYVCEMGPVVRYVEESSGLLRSSSKANGNGCSGWPGCGNGNGYASPGTAPSSSTKGKQRALF